MTTNPFPLYKQIFYNCRMPFRKNVLKCLAAAIVLCAFCASQSAAEEKSLWQKFVDWFKPAPSLEGEGPLYDELRELENQIDRTEGRYSRERRPGNKTRIKKELEDLKIKRDKLIEKIREEEKAKKNAPAATTTAAPAQSVPASSSATANKPTPVAKEICAHDTVFVRDTVVVHDTLYVIVSGKPAQEQPATQPATNTADSSTADSTTKPAADSATVPSNK